MDPRATEVVQFWFGPDEVPTPAIAQRWFVKDPTFDAEIRIRFGALIEAAGSPSLDGWIAEPMSGLALIVVLDQFPRNVFRGSGLAFAHDAKALAASRALIAAGRERSLTAHQRMVTYLPFVHAEDRWAQTESLERYTGLVADVKASKAAPGVIKTMESALEHAREHATLIERFGRFPHRNAALGRTSTEDEALFLATPGAGF